MFLLLFFLNELYSQFFVWLSDHDFGVRISTRKLRLPSSYFDTILCPQTYNGESVTPFRQINSIDYGLTTNTSLWIEVGVNVNV